jgi:hypothetical protein
MFVGDNESNDQNLRDHGYSRRQIGRIWVKTGYQSVRGNGRTIFIHPITKDEKDILQFEL